MSKRTRGRGLYLACACRRFRLLRRSLHVHLSITALHYPTSSTTVIFSASRLPYVAHNAHHYENCLQARFKSSATHHLTVSSRKTWKHREKDRLLHNATFRLRESNSAALKASFVSYSSGSRSSRISFCRFGSLSTLSSANPFRKDCVALAYIHGKKVKSVAEDETMSTSRGIFHASSSGYMA